jgi:alkylation response protein AidB-like acyl-CoA dehydrogenase
MAMDGSLCCVDLANRYALKRVRFGGRIVEFQAVRHLLADALASPELVRAYLFNVAFLSVYVTEYSVERVVRDMRMFLIGGGPSEVQRELICRETGWISPH